MVALVAPCVMQAQTKDMWDYVTSFHTTTGRQQNIASDGQYIYTSTYSKAPGNNPPVNSMFYKYDFDGNLIEEFDIAGCDHLRDLTYDGQYFYGGSAADGHESRLYCVDLANKTVIGYVTTTLESIRHCSYDPVNDGFWVGTSTTLVRINREGQTVATIAGVPASGIYCSGSGYFTGPEGDAHLFMFCNNSITPYVYDYNITTNTFNNTPVLEFANTPGYVIYGGAGGAFAGDYNGSLCFYGDSPASPNFIGIYSLGDSIAPPTPPTPPEGDVFFDFEDAFMLWTNIDADGDGYKWELNRNWGNSTNTYSLISRSRDELLGINLTPDNYLVTPYKIDCQLLTFKACVMDPMYPNEHLGVAISTEGNTDPDDFITIWETDMTAKPTGQWYDFSVDLRDYAGQDIWIAFRHFNCKDQFALMVDDITLVREWDAVSDNTGTTLSVYPNPANDLVQVKSKEKVDSYELYNMTGALIRRREVNAASFEIDLHGLSAGAYLLKTRSESMTQTQRLVKQ